MVDVGNCRIHFSAEERLLNVERDNQASKTEPSENAIEKASRKTPCITIHDPDKNRITRSESGSATETEMSSSHRSSHHHSSSSSKGKGKGRSSSSSSKSHKDDWSEITDPDERRRVQNRIAQRKFRDKAKETKERQEREARDRAHAGNAYNIPDPTEMGADDELSGLPWGSLSLKYVVSRGMARESESWRGSPKDEDRSYDGSQGRASDDRDAHYEEDSTYYGEGDHAYYDYGSGSGSGHGGSSG